MSRGNTRREGHGLPILILALGVAAVALLVGSDVVRHRADERGRAVLSAVAQVEVDIAIAHLWLEEHVSGDQVDLDEFEDRLARAARLSVDLTRRSTGETLHARAEALVGWISEFRALSNERLEGFAAGESVGIGSPTDERYDAVFAEVFGQTQALGAALGEHLQRERVNDRMGAWMLVALWCGLIVGTAVLLRRNERRRRRTERALDSSQVQLVEAQKIEAVGRLAGGLAHDLNNYLAAIRGHCELVARRPDQVDHVTAKMTRVLALTEKASSLIDRLQGFTQRRPPHRQVLDVRQLVEGVAAMVQPTVGERVRLETEVASDLRPIAADPAQLEQVLVNLVLNARDAMPDGGAIRVTARNHGPSEVQLAVHDEGIGIDPALQARIFEPLMSTKGGSHTGLGLSIVHQIVTAHDGQITVASTVDRGTVFQLVLPATDQPLPAVSGPGDPAVPDTGGLEGREHLLLVDDNDDFREATAAQLDDLGYRVTTARDGAAALAAFHRDVDGFELVLTDVIMPGMGGRELVERIRREREIKVIYLSGHSHAVLGSEPFGADDVQMTKGMLTGALLARQIRSLLDA